MIYIYEYDERDTKKNASKKGNQLIFNKSQSCFIVKSNENMTKESKLPLLHPGNLSFYKNKIYQYIHPFFSVLKREFCNMFLPVGYPQSVAEEYLSFQLWDTLQAFCSYLRGVLATQSILETIGVGKESVTPIAAALQWILRDGSGMLGGLFFTYFMGSKFDSEVKFWRLFADCILDIGLCLDMIAPSFSSYGIEILCISSICKSLCGVSAGSTRSALTAHFAKHDNMADIAAKEGSQETAVTLIGMIIGMYFANAVNGWIITVWISFLFLTALHIFANYQAVYCLNIPNINRQRANLLIETYRHHQNKNKISCIKSFKRSMNISSINKRENIFSLNSYYNNYKICIGHDLQKIVINSMNEMDEIISLFRNELYLILRSKSNQQIHIILHVTSNAETQLKGFYHVIRLFELMQMHSTSISFISILKESINGLDVEFQDFLQKLEENQWKTNRYLLNIQSWRYEWNQELI